MKYFLITFFLAILFFQNKTNADDITLTLENNAIFKSYDTGAWEEYSKLESVGCSTRISIWDDQLRIISDIECYMIKNKKENIVEIAKSISEIVKYFKLENKIKSIRTVAIVFSSWHLLQAINNDENWPRDIQVYVKNNFNNISEIKYFVTDKISQIIISSKIYDPIVSILGKYGCNVDLKKLNIDGLFIEEHPLTKEDLIEQKVFTENEIKKDTFPNIADMWFDVKGKLKEGVRP